MFTLSNKRVWESIGLWKLFYLDVVNIWFQPRIKVAVTSQFLCKYVKNYRTLRMIHSGKHAILTFYGYIGVM